MTTSDTDRALEFFKKHHLTIHQIYEPPIQLGYTEACLKLYTAARKHFAAVCPECGWAAQCEHTDAEGGPGGDTTVVTTAEGVTGQTDPPPDPHDWEPFTDEATGPMEQCRRCQLVTSVAGQWADKPCVNPLRDAVQRAADEVAAMPDWKKAGFDMREVITLKSNAPDPLAEEMRQRIQTHSGVAGVMTVHAETLNRWAQTIERDYVRKAP